MHPLGKLTSFDQLVLEATRAIPPGRVASYQWLAKQLGRGSARAVGRSLRKNPYAPEVPCHRIICSNGTLGGYFGATGGALAERKRGLLAAEGVHFSAAGRLLDPGRMM